MVVMVLLWGGASPRLGVAGHRRQVGRVECCMRWEGMRGGGLGDKRTDVTTTFVRVLSLLQLLELVDVSIFEAASLTIDGSEVLHSYPAPSLLRG